MGFNGCKDGPSGNGSGDGDGEGGTPTGKVLSPEETKETMKGIADNLIGKFNTEDQKAALELMDDMIYKYENYDFSPIGNYYENRYEDLFAGPRYMCAVLKGASPVPAMNHSYTFSFSDESVIWEADDANRTWVKKGPSPDNSLIMRAKDQSGTMCEAKFWGEGATKTYTQSWEEDYETHTITAIVPETIRFSFKHGNDVLASAKLKQDINENDHVTLNAEASVCNLRWTMDMDIRLTNGSVGYAFYYGNESLVSALINLPSYKLTAKGSNQSYEEWVEQYAENYDALIRQIGNANAVLDINGRVQGKVNVNNVGQSYSSIMNMMNQINPETQEGATQYCNTINQAQSNGLYIDNAKQAEVRLIVANDGDYYYRPEPVLYFTSDKTSYSFEQYFNRPPFTELQQSLENLVNSYIHLSTWLSSEVRDVEF